MNHSIQLSFRAPSINVLFFLVLLFGSQIHTTRGQDELGTIQVKVTGNLSQEVAFRMHLKDAQGKVVKVSHLPFWHDHFVCDGHAKIELKPGRYSWEVEKGPEFERKSGSVTVRSGKTSQVELSLRRVAHLNRDGWFSGDLHVHRNIRDIKLLMKAEDLNFAPVITWWNRPAKNAQPSKETEFKLGTSRVYTNMGGEDEREGGALLFFGLDRPLDLTVKSREYPSPMHFVRQARDWNPGVWIDIEKPFWWDVPVWLASQKMNSIGLANNHMCRSQMYLNEAWGKPRNEELLPNPRGNGFWTQEIYYHILNTGIRIPPSAGSASGVLPNPVGYNRVYVKCEQPMDRKKWFEALEHGRCFVTNGPLLRVQANRQDPGNTFDLSKPKGKSIQLEIELTTHDFVPTVEVVLNGRIVKKIKCEEKLHQKLSTTVQLDEPGWFLVRSIADVKNTFRFASTAPWYLTDGDQNPAIKKESSQFFLDWTRERMERVKKNVKNKEERSHVLKHHVQALEFWQRKLDQSK